MFAFLARVVRCLRHFTRHPFFVAGLFYSCWILLGIIVLLDAVVSSPWFTETQDRTYDVIYSSGNASYVALIYAIFSIEYRRALDECLLCQERLISLFFFTQIMGQVADTVYSVAKLADRTEPDRMLLLSCSHIAPRFCLRSFRPWWSSC